MQACCSCESAKTKLNCGLCGGALCKSCVQFVDEEALSFLEKVPAELQHDAYCPQCYSAQVAPVLDEQSRVMERARDVNVFFRNQGKESRFIRRSEKPIQVKDCSDRDDVVLRLAFLAAQAGFNCIIDVDVDQEKIRMGGWQTSKWSGRAIPANVDQAQLERKFISAPN